MMHHARGREHAYRFTGRLLRINQTGVKNPGERKSRGEKYRFDYSRSGAKFLSHPEKIQDFREYAFTATEESVGIPFSAQNRGTKLGVSLFQGKPERTEVPIRATGKI